MVLISQSHQLCKVRRLPLYNQHSIYVELDKTESFGERYLVECANISHLNITGSHIPTIPPQACNNFSRLIKELHLDHNEVDEMKSQIFNQLYLPEVLNLGNNRIVTVDKAAFLGVAKLEVLNLRNNQITTLEEELLVEQLHLKELDLSGNPIANTSDDILPTSLKKLYLNETYLSEISFNISYLTLNTLNMKRNQFSKIDCAFLPSMNELDLCDNKISTIINLKLLRASQLNLNNNDIRGLSGLLSLNLDNNNITDVEAGLFKDLDSLNKLNLSHNSIEQIKFGTIDYLPYLLFLDLSYNKLISLHPNTLRLLSNLRELYFDNNQISNKASLSGVDNLEVLNLRNNQITRIEEESFVEQLRLKELDLFGNPITYIAIFNLKFLRAVNVYLSNNLRVIDGVFPTTIERTSINDNKLETLEPSFNKSKTLTDLDVSSNKISTINKIAFEGLSKLYSLKLNNNNITSLEAVWFKDLKSLNQFNLSHNNIEQIEFGTFDSLRDLSILDVSYNKLTSLHLDTSHLLAELWKLYFDNNQISNLDIDAMMSLKHLHPISLDNNSFSCQDLVNIDCHALVSD
ncbi:toll-like receptor 6 [Zophobas morio]|uniref:toll-like receptor 6 n=1 Tax=Zophobas morio TaxID=2755281 RepID=UPI003082EF95